MKDYPGYYSGLIQGIVVFLQKLNFKNKIT